MDRLIINEELFALEEQCSQLVRTIKASSAMKEYKQAKNQLTISISAQTKIARFQEAKDKLEAIEKYREYAPDFFELRQAVFQAKRVMDMDEAVYQYRVTERTLQVQLDLIAKKIASAVSKNILVTAGGAFSLSATGLPEVCQIHIEKRKDSEL